MDQDRQSARENFRQLSGKEKFQHILRVLSIVQVLLHPGSLHWES